MFFRLFLVFHFSLSVHGGSILCFKKLYISVDVFLLSLEYFLGFLQNITLGEEPI